MSFTFTNYAGIAPQESTWENALNKAFQGYTNMTNARYLQPTLEEELKKQKLHNQYYGPNMESQIGLRGAQAGQAKAHTGLLGEQTRAAHMTNEFLPQQLKAQQQAAQLRAIQDQMFNQMLKQRLSGAQMGNPMQGQPSPEYIPGQGNAPYMQQPEQSPFAQGQQVLPPAPQQMPFDFNQAPQLTNDDIVNKKVFGQDTFTPKYKAYVDAVTSGMKKKEAEQYKLQAKQAYDDFQTSDNAQKDIPVINDALQAANRMKEVIQNRPSFFGHYITPGLFAKRATDPLVGEFIAEMVPQIAGVEKQLSEKGNQLALRISESKMPQFSDSQAVALGKVNALINELTKRLTRSQDLAGGNIARRGSRRFKNIDGHWYELDKGA